VRYSLRQHQEGGLKSILGILRVMQNTPANAQDEAPVSVDNGCKGGFIVAASELLEQLPIIHLLGDLWPKQFPNVPDS